LRADGTLGVGGAILKENSNESSPFTDRENMLWGLQLALGHTFNESVLSKESRDGIDHLIDLKRLAEERRLEGWRYFSRVHRFWILWFALLLLGVALLPIIIGAVFFVGDVFLYRWIRKREKTTPKASLESLELSRTFAKELQILHDKVKVETSQLPAEKASYGLLEKSAFVGRAVWIVIDADSGGTVFADRKGIVVRLFKDPPAHCKEAMAVELASPPLTFFPWPKRLRYIIAEYYNEWDSIRHSFTEGHSYVRFVRLKNKTVLKSDTYRIKDTSRIGAGLITAWPVLPTEARLLSRREGG